MKNSDLLNEKDLPLLERFMQEAVREAREGIQNRHGGPFGTVIVKDGTIVGRGHNRVLFNHDPTCHGEIAAIREAGGVLQTSDLSGCVLFTTAEPCAMCLFACLWANIDRVYYGCTIEDTARIGFRDELFDKLVDRRGLPENYLVGFGREFCRDLFQDYLNMEHEIY